MSDTSKKNRKESASADSAARPRVFTGVFVAIIILSFTCFMVSQGLNSGTPVYISRLGGTTTFAGIMGALFFIAAALTRMITGYIVDAKSRIIGMVSGSTILLIGVTAPLINDNFLLFALCRVLQGVGFSIATTASATAAADVLPIERLGEGIGYSGLGQAIAMSIGPAFALYMVMTDPPQNLFIGLTCFAILGVMLTYFCRYEHNPQALPPTSGYRLRWERTHHIKQDLPTSEKNSIKAEEKILESAAQSAWWEQFFEIKALPGTIPLIPMGFVFGFGIFFMGLHGTMIGVANPGLYFTISAMGVILVRVVAGRFMDRTPAIKLFGVAVTFGTLAFIMQIIGEMLLPENGVAAGSLTEYLYFAAGFPYGLCVGFSLPVNQMVAIKNSPSSRWGAANGLLYFVFDACTGIGAGLWGVVNENLGFMCSFIGVIICLVTAFLLACWSYPPRQKQWRKSRS